MRSKQKVWAVVLVNAALAIVFATTQNCGRVNIAAPVEIESASLAVSVSSELVIKVKTNVPETFVVPTKDGSASIANLSFEPQGAALETETSLLGSVEINPENWDVTYVPAIGLVGNDRATLYVTGTDQKQVAISVVFEVSNQEDSPSEKLNALVYGSTTDDRKYLDNKLKGLAPPGMSEIFGQWEVVSGSKSYTSHHLVEAIPAGLPASCSEPINKTTGLYDQFYDDLSTPEVRLVTPGGIPACVANPAFVARSWVLLNSPERIYCGSNAGVVTGFVSPGSFEYYKLEATVSSNNTDDDAIGLIMAYHNDGTNIHVLAAVRNQGGVAPANEGWGIVYYKNGLFQKVLAAKPVGPNPTNKNSECEKYKADGVTCAYKKSGWVKLVMDAAGKVLSILPRFSKIQVIRSGNLFTVTASPYSESESSVDLDIPSQLLLDLSDSSFDLATSKIMANFTGPKQYGYMSLSQMGSDFRGVTFSTGATESYVYDLMNKIVFEKQASGIFKQRLDVDAFTHIGAPRNVVNPDTGKIFQLNANKTYKLLN